MTVIDCVKSPPVNAMRAAGVTGVCRYLSWADQRDTLGKVIHQAEYGALRSAGFDIVLNWEYSANDWLGGSSAGAAHAAEAIRQARALGYPAGCAIPGSADFNMTAAQWQSAGRGYAVAYSRGIISGGYVAGVYGPWDVLTWCQQLGGFGMFWQSMSTSWSGGRNASRWPGAHLWQRRSGFVGGYDVDFNDVLQADYGQYGVDAAAITVGGDTVTFLAQAGNTAGSTTQYYRCDGMRSVPITREQAIDMIGGLVPSGAITLQHSTSGGNDIYWTSIAGVNGTDGWVRMGWSEAFGALDTTSASPPTDDQVDAAVAKVMNDPAWLEQLAAAFASHIHVS